MYLFKWLIYKNIHCTQSSFIAGVHMGPRVAGSDIGGGWQFFAKRVAIFYIGGGWQFFANRVAILVRKG